MRKGPLAVCAASLLLLVAAAFAREVIILKGGTRIDLREPPVQQGNNVLLTRSDGTLFSVPASDVDWKATAAARKAPAAPPASAVSVPPETPAEAARLSREGPKARVKITDADVNHDVLPDEEKKEPEASTGAATGTAHLEVADYTQSKSGANLMVQGSLRNVGATSALNAHMSVTALDPAGNGIGSANASLSKGDVEAGQSVSFSAALPVGDKIISSIRFSPLWTPVPAPAPAGAANSAASSAPASSTAAAAGASPSARPAAPTPVPTPYGQGLLYAAPAPPASMSPPANGKDGYIPGAARKEDQPTTPH